MKKNERTLNKKWKSGVNNGWHVKTNFYNTPFFVNKLKKILFKNK